MTRRAKYLVYNGCRDFLAESRQTQEFIVYATITIGISILCVCAVTDNEFHHDIIVKVNVVCRSTWLLLHGSTAYLLNLRRWLLQVQFLPLERMLANNWMASNTTPLLPFPAIYLVNNQAPGCLFQQRHC